jgi:hypothetical protein
MTKLMSDGSSEELVQILLLLPGPVTRDIVENGRPETVILVISFKCKA